MYVCDYKHTFSYPKSSPKIVVLKVSNSKGLKFGAPCQIRTGDLLIRTQMLYPTELMAHKTTLLYDFCIAGLSRTSLV